MKSNLQNQIAWEHRVYECWSQHFGSSEIEATKILNEPKYPMRRYLKYFEEIEGKTIFCPLGSCGRRSLSLSLLGGKVTHLDFSEGNIQFAKEMSDIAQQDIEFVYQDFMTYQGKKHDICFMEGGILHYFHDLDAYVQQVRKHTKLGGRFILNDFHPFRKVFTQRDIFESDTNFETTGDYFDTDIHEGAVAFEKLMDENDFPKCSLRYYTMSEILNALINNGFQLLHMAEGPRFDSHKHLPGDFTLVLKAI